MLLLATLLSSGAVPFLTDAGASAQVGVQGYVGGAPLGTVAAVAATDGFFGGVKYTANGSVRLYDATAGLPAGSRVLGGFAVSTDGQLCYTTAAPDSSSVFIGGVACTQDGRVHVAP